MWVRFNPIPDDKLYTYEIYDSETKEVKEISTMWFEHTTHYVRGKNGLRSFNCSSTAHRNKPCWGCAYRSRFYDTLRLEEKKTGVRKSGDKAKPSVDGSPQFSFNLSIMENIFAVPKVDGSGHPVMSKHTRQPIMKHIPESLMGRGAKGIGTSGFGRKMHLTVSKRGLNQILDLDDDLRAHCLNCARPMACEAMACVQCEELKPLGDALTGAELVEVMKAEDWACDACGNVGKMMPIVTCECGNPQHGFLTAFDVKLKAKKSTDEDKLSTLEVMAVRLPKIANPQQQADLVDSWLDLKAIFTPDSPEHQKNQMGDFAQGLYAEYGMKGHTAEAAAPPAESYADAGGIDDSDDSDGATF